MGEDTSDQVYHLNFNFWMILIVGVVVLLTWAVSGWLKQRRIKRQIAREFDRDEEG